MGPNLAGETLNIARVFRTNEKDKINRLRIDWPDLLRPLVDSISESFDLISIAVELTVELFLETYPLSGVMVHS